MQSMLGFDHIDVSMHLLLDLVVFDGLFREDWNVSLEEVLCQQVVMVIFDHPAKGVGFRLAFFRLVPFR